MVEETEVDEEDQVWREERNDSRVCIQELADMQNNFVSPIDLNIAEMVHLCLPPLIFHHHELICKKMKCLNSGHTLILSAKWYEERPYLSGGPLLDNYVFSQLHFHWGATDMEGSEHTIDGTQHPMEMHVVYFKSCYLTQEAALREKDGVVIVAYICKLQSQANPEMQIIINSAKLVKRAGLAIRMDKHALCEFFQSFKEDYFVYWGSIITTADTHVILWIIAREPIGVSVKQVETFRKMLGEDGQPICRNFRYVQDSEDKPVYHVNPSSCQYATLLPLTRICIPKTRKSKSSSKDRLA